MKTTIISFFATIIIGFVACEKDEPKETEETPIFSENFDSTLSQWVVEQIPGGTTEIVNGKLEINDYNGVTIWFKEKMTGDIRIEYDIFMIDSGGKYDNVRDLNSFWKAIDPDNPDDIFANSSSRTGQFREYNAFRLYYVGYGGRENTTTRFRRYPGDGTTPLLPEHDLSDSSLLNVPNIERHVTITCKGNQVTWAIDTTTVFDYYDEEPFEDGWFGFRTVSNHMTIDNFKVFSLEEEEEQE